LEADKVGRVGCS